MRRLIGSWRHNWGGQILWRFPLARKCLFWFWLEIRILFHPRDSWETSFEHGLRSFATWPVGDPQLRRSTRKPPGNMYSLIMIQVVVRGAAEGDDRKYIVAHHSWATFQGIAQFDAVSRHCLAPRHWIHLDHAVLWTILTFFAAKRPMQERFGNQVAGRIAACLFFFEFAIILLSVSCRFLSILSCMLFTWEPLYFYQLSTTWNSIIILMCRANYHTNV